MLHVSCSKICLPAKHYSIQASAYTGVDNNDLVGENSRRHRSYRARVDS